MAKLKFIIAVLVTAGLALALGLQYSSTERMRRENESLKLALAELKQSQATREPVSGDDSAARAQLAELLRLRGEVTRLRQETNQIAALAEENKKLEVSLVSLKQSSPPSKIPMKKNPEDALPQDIHPKDTWAFRGYGTPESTVESVCWAMANGDKTTFMGGMSPEMLDEVKDEDVNKFAEDIKKVSNTEFRILDRRQVSDDEMMLTIYMTRDSPGGHRIGSSENTVFKRINGEWKVTDKHQPDN